MQYGEQVSQRKPDSSLKGVTFPSTVSDYNFGVMNILH